MNLSAPGPKVPPLRIPTGADPPAGDYDSKQQLLTLPVSQEDGSSVAGSAAGRGGVKEDAFLQLDGYYDRMYKGDDDKDSDDDGGSEDSQSSYERCLDTCLGNLAEALEDEQRELLQEDDESDEEDGNDQTTNDYVSDMADMLVSEIKEFQIKRSGRRSSAFQSASMQSGPSAQESSRIQESAASVATRSRTQAHFEDSDEEEDGGGAEEAYKAVQNTISSVAKKLMEDGDTVPRESHEEREARMKHERMKQRGDKKLPSRQKTKYEEMMAKEIEQFQGIVRERLAKSAPHDQMADFKPTMIPTQAVKDAILTQHKHYQEMGVPNPFARDEKAEPTKEDKTRAIRYHRYLTGQDME